MRITARGQVTIPQDIRERAGLTPGTDVEFELEGGAVRLVRARRGAGRKSRGETIVDALRGGGDFKMTTGGHGSDAGAQGGRRVRACSSSTPTSSSTS